MSAIHKALSTVFLLAFVLHVSAAQAQGVEEQRGADLMARLQKANAGWKDMSARVAMDLRDASGRTSRREMRLKMLEVGEGETGHSLLVFDSPADVRGTALLSRSGDEAQQYLFLPASNRVRRITGGSRAGSFVGSEFTYEDISGLVRSEHRFRLIEEKPCGAAICYVVEATPRYAGSAYQRRLLWIDKEELRPSKVEFFDRRGQRLKTLTYDDYQRYGERHWRAARWAMENHQTGRSTTLVFADFGFARGLEERDFTASSLKRLR